MASISVIIPSRLEGAFLESAIGSIRSQEGVNQSAVQIIVGVDRGSTPPKIPGVEFVESKGSNQSAALNAAVAHAKGDYIAFLEDDDEWRPAFVKTALSALERSEFVSSTLLVVATNGEVIRIGDFPAPSGWIMHRSTFEAVGHFNESFRWHVDNEWLGRLGEIAKSRSHLIEATAPIDEGWIRRLRPWLANVLDLSRPAVRLIRHSDPIPLVKKLEHVGRGTNRIAASPELTAQSRELISCLQARYGRIPW